MSAFLNQITLQINRTKLIIQFKGIKISIEESKEINVEKEIQDFKKHMSSIFIEFVRLVNLKKYGKALQMATKFTDDVGEFHNKISLNNSTEIMYSVLNNLKTPLQNWRDFLEDHFYFDDTELLRKWIDVEKKYLSQKWDFMFDQRAYRSELGSCKFSITIYS